MKCPCDDCICRPICRQKGISKGVLTTKDGTRSTNNFVLELSKTCPLLHEYIQEGLKADVQIISDSNMSVHQERIVEVRLLFNIDVDPRLEKIYNRKNFPPEMPKP